MSESTISQHAEEILGMELGFGFDVPCVVHWSLMWFSASTRLNEILGQDLKIKMYHEVVDTPRSCMLIQVAKIFSRTQKVESEQGDGMMDDEGES